VGDKRGKENPRGIAKGVIMDKVSFKSQEPFFSKEADGRKPNTIRRLAEDDPRRIILLRWMNHDTYGEIEITLVHGSKGFTRQVVDVSLFEGWFIISWKHPINIMTKY
jgi:hypothetical protein